MRALEDYLSQLRLVLESGFSGSRLEPWWQAMWPDIVAALPAHGSSAKWEHALSSLPTLPPTSVDAGPVVRVGREQDLSREQHEILHTSLSALSPWRKGPFDFFGVVVDSEWRSDWKWQRLIDHVRPLEGRRVLDVGCGNGYYAWRMLGAGARVVVGMDPGVLCVQQFRAALSYQPHAPIALLPLGSEALDRDLAVFDSVFSMGVLYHRRDPLEHLRELRRALRDGGELVLETLVIDSDACEALAPPGRYARMRNVWTVPSPTLVQQWLREAGFAEVRCVDVTVTGIDEQRATPWMTFNSLRDFLDREDPAFTVEGHPAPTRALFIATTG